MKTYKEVLEDLRNDRDCAEIDNQWGRVEDAVMQINMLKEAYGKCDSKEFEDLLADVDNQQYYRR